MREVWLIRHAESLANAGGATSTPRDIPLTDVGKQQAKHIESLPWPEPDKIVVSPYIRTQQTAEHVIGKFSGVEPQFADVHEFTYLAISKCRNTTQADRRPMVEEYWQRNDPNYADGDQAESFAQFIYRTDLFLAEALNDRLPLTFVFTHEQFIKAVIWRLMQPQAVIDGNFMRGYCNFMNSIKIKNTALMKVAIQDNARFLLGEIETEHIKDYA